MLITPNLQLPYIDVNAAQREVVHNEAIRALDALVQLAVLDRDLTAPPASPADGVRYIVGAGATGAWSGHAAEIAAWQDGAWRFHVPRTGWLAYVVDEGALLAWDGGAWVDALAMVTSLQNMVLLGIGTVADATNPFSARLNNALWAARTVAEGGDGNLRHKLSKESAAKTLSLLMQTGFSGRAEIGLTGDDDFRVKVSPDGTTWHEGIVIDKDTGAVSFPNTSIGGGGTTELARKVNGLTPHENLVLRQVSATQVDIDADAVVLFDAAGNSKRFAGLDETLAITAAGANGLDTGTEAPSTWYHIWAIGKSDGTLDGLLSASATTPTLPSGYSYKGYLGAVRNNGSGNFNRFHQIANRVWPNIVDFGAALSGGTQTNYTAINLSAIVPPNAKVVGVRLAVWSSSGTNVVTLYVASSGSLTSADLYDTRVRFNVDGSAGYVNTMVELVTPQQIAYRVGGTNATGEIYIIEWHYL